ESKELAARADDVARIRERRNEVLHGRRDDHDPTKTLRAWPTLSEASACVNIVNTVASELRAALRARFASHTRVHALRTLWDYLWGASPLMPFDDFWVVDEEKGRVVATKEPKIIGQLSGSERMLLGVWRAEFNSDTSLLERRFSMKHLDAERRRDLVTLLAA